MIKSKTKSKPTTPSVLSTPPAEFYFSAAPIDSNTHSCAYGPEVNEVRDRVNDFADTGNTVEELFRNIQDNCISREDLEIGKEYEFGVYEVRLVGRYKISQPPTTPIIQKIK